MALGDIFDRWRLNQGWNPWDNNTQMAAISSFVYTLDSHGVPATAYSELYERVLRSRVVALQNGKQLPNFGVELLLAEWLGPHGLRNELKTRDIDSGRMLTSNAESICLKCDGTGMERIFKDGKMAGVRPGCRHEYTPDQVETISGFEKMDAAVKERVIATETAVQIIARLRKALAFDFVTNEHDQQKAQNAWNASKILIHAENYCFDNPEVENAD